ncbi:MAG TPA: glycosyl hydrolase family 18 protein [Bacilli bacterium]
MKRLTKYIVTICIGMSFMLPLSALQALAKTAHSDLTTKYRVYQKNHIISEFADLNKAIALAKTLATSRVEDIKTHKWLWDNYPRYRVYQYDNTLASWQFTDLDEAIKEARKWAHASVRDLQAAGWVWNNYPKAMNFRVYQGDKTLPKWEFPTYEAALKEAKKWAHSHIIDLRTNKWVWDNLTDAEKQAAANGEPQYAVSIDGFSLDGWKFASLYDAVAFASGQDEAVVAKIATNEIVYANKLTYQVYQNDHYLKQFHQIDDAIAYAKKWANATIKTDNRAIWTNVPYYQVLQNDKPLKRFNTLKEALKYAQWYSNASIRTAEGETIWDNLRELLYWAWNGSASPSTILTEAANAMGLDVDSPTWFELDNENGAVTDTSNPSVVSSLHNLGIKVYPLVSNSFDSKMTSRFLNNKQAQVKFIHTVVDRIQAIGADGINVDFESMPGSVRDEFTAFMQKFADYAKQKGLKISVDLPRGSLSWNELTAFDHAKLAEIVDYIIIMAYDQYYSGSDEPGSVSGIPWTDGGIREFLSYGIPRDKLILGMPFYSRLWKLNKNGNLVGNRTLTQKDIPDLLANTAHKITWDEQFGQYRIEFSQDGYRYVFWLEDEQTLVKRIKLADQYDLAGIAAWRLGHENPEIWKTLIKEK